MVLAVLAGTVACGGDADGQGRGSTVHFGDTSLPTGPHRVHVGLIEWSITLSRSTVPPGRTVLLVTNAGATVHNLAVSDQPPGSPWKTPDLQPGQHARLVVRGTAGENLKLWCAEPGHEEQGMLTTLHVRAP